MGAVKQQAMEDAENILNVTAEKLIGGDITEDDALEILDNNMDNLEILGFETNNFTYESFFLLVSCKSNSRRLHLDT